MFSSRLPASLAPNALMETLSALRRSETPWLDLTETNPTTVGIAYPVDLERALARPEARVYEPAPFGLRVAREAIAEDYARQGRQVPVDRIVVTTSTSESYSLLFKLLCDPGNVVLVPQPSYPLFELLGGLDGVRLAPYRLHLHDGWSIDRESVLARLTPDVRVLLVVSPNNPTGSRLRQEDWAWLVDVAAPRQIALVVDEVFLDYPLSPRSDAVSPTGGEPVLTICLGGLSKSAGLPQMKLGWMAVGGPDVPVDGALRRLEVVCDTYLSVSTPVQAAAADFIRAGAAIRTAIQTRIVRNLDALRRSIGPRAAVTLLEPEGGWSAVWQVPAIEGEEALVLRLLTSARVLVHPGYFFDFPHEAFLVTSLLPRPEVFDEAVGRMVPAIGGRS